MRIYTYTACGTCRKATQWLKAHNHEFETIPIREQPPTLEELERMLKSLDGQLRRLFNTSGQDYRSMGLKDQLPGMSTQQALNLLQSNGNLIKRPFLLSMNWNTVGFNPTEWESHLG